MRQVALGLRRVAARCACCMTSAKRSAQRIARLGAPTLAVCETPRTRRDFSPRSATRRALTQAQVQRRALTSPPAAKHIYSYLAGCPLPTSAKRFPRRRSSCMIKADWSQSFRFVVESRALTEPLFFVPFEMPVRRAVFSEGSRQPCRLMSRSPAAIAVRHLRSPVASRTFTPAAVSASQAAVQVVAPSVRHSAMTADRPTTATARPVRMADMSAPRVRCSARRARAVASKRRYRFNRVTISRCIARRASSSVAALGVPAVGTAEVATEREDRARGRA